MKVIQLAREKRWWYQVLLYTLTTIVSTMSSSEVVNVLVKPAMYIAVLGIRYHAHMHISY